MWPEEPPRQRGVPTPSVTPQRTPTRGSRTLEDVWQAITRPSIPVAQQQQQHDHHHNPNARNIFTPPPSFGGVVLQDFLTAGSFRETTTANEPRPRSLQLPSTVLTLRSLADFQFPDSAMGRPAAFDEGCRHHGLFSRPFALFSSPGGSPTPNISPLSNKRGPSGQQLQRADGSGEGSDIHQHKRMIKNRESSARSRARKQAYINELEHEVTRLIEENIKLTQQYDELRLVMAAQLPARKAILRTSTSPF